VGAAESQIGLFAPDILTMLIWWIGGRITPYSKNDSTVESSIYFPTEVKVFRKPRFTKAHVV
jgi:hypothetical protein